MPEHFAGNADALVERKERALVGAVRHADHQFVEDVRRTADQILVSPGHWIEGAGIDRDDHTSSLICPLPAVVAASFAGRTGAGAASRAL
ncbi:hypothetical protein D9M71_739520 [compost metagenome]